MMWASMIVSSDSRIPSWVNSSSADTPATISGVTSGTSIRTFAPPVQRVRARTSPNASSVPSIVPTTIVTVAISMLARSDERQRLVVEEALVPLEREAGEALQRALAS